MSQALLPLQVLAVSAALTLATMAHPVSKTFTTPNGFKVTLHQTACKPPVKDALLDEFVPKFKGGTIEFKGDTIAICWIAEAGGGYTVVDSAGQEMPIPKQ